MRLREPAAVVALVGVALHVVLSVLSAADSPVPVGRTLGDLAYRIADPVLLVLLTALLVACWLPEPTPHARGLTVTGLLLTASLLAAILVLAVVALTAASWPGGSGTHRDLLRTRRAGHRHHDLPRRADRPARRPAQQPATPPAAEPAGRRARTGPAAAAHLDPGRGGRYGMAAGWGRCVTEAVDELGQPWSDPGRMGPRSSPDPPPEPTRRAGE